MARSLLKSLLDLAAAWFQCHVRRNLKLEIVKNKKYYVKVRDLIHHDSIHLDSNIEVGNHQFKGQILLNVSHV